MFGLITETRHKEEMDALRKELKQVAALAVKKANAKSGITARVKQGGGGKWGVQLVDADNECLFILAAGKRCETREAARQLAEKNLRISEWID